MSAPIAAIGAINAADELSAAAAAAAPVRQQPFELVEKMVNDVSDKVTNADNQVRQMALGRTDNLHDVMFALEDARISMGLMVQVRNRLVDAYQDLMRMQI
jgi:flagellar hook-basal body complex protein FliE